MLAAAAGNIDANDRLRENIVKIYVTKSEHDYFNPWQMKDRYTVEGSGAIIEGNLVLTNAHLVSDSTFIQVKRTGQTRKFTARVRHVGHLCDLAVLEVKNPSFFPQVLPLSIGELCRVGDEITVFGFPNWNEQLTITRGIVSRVSHDQYAHSRARLLSCQIDAAINHGNSGGPVMDGGKVVGVAMQGGRGENEGYMVPVPVIEHFLDDIADGSYNGTPDLGISYQTMENGQMRAYYGMGEHHSGILVHKIAPSSPARGVLQPDDVILSVDGRAVANDGTVVLRGDERTQFEYLVQQQQLGDRTALQVLRNKTTLQLTLKLDLSVGESRLVPFRQYDEEPTYYIFAGFIFVPLTENILLDFGGWFDAPLILAYPALYGEAANAGEQVILIIDVLSDEVNAGYEDFYYETIAKVNGEPVHSMTDLIRSIETSRKPYHVLATARGDKIIIDRKLARKSRRRILETYRIESDRSADLRTQ
jgi:S1-C subfamily serine protease